MFIKWIEIEEIKKKKYDLKKNSIKKKELLKIRVFLRRGSSARPRYLETLQPWYPVNKAV